MKSGKYKRYLFLSTIIVATGIWLNIMLSHKIGATGIVFIAIGGLLFIIGMRIKKEEDSKNDL